MDYDHGTSLQSWNEVPQDLDAILIRPIMKYPAQMIDLCSDWRRCKEVAAERLSPTLWEVVTVPGEGHYLLGHKVDPLAQVTGSCLLPFEPHPADPAQCISLLGSAAQFLSRYYHEIRRDPQRRRRLAMRRLREADPCRGPLSRRNLS
jgi:hypothetical protein